MQEKRSVFSKVWAFLSLIIHWEADQVISGRDGKLASWRPFEDLADGDEFSLGHHLAKRVGTVSPVSTSSVAPPLRVVGLQYGSCNLQLPKWPGIGDNRMEVFEASA